MSSLNLTGSLHVEENDERLPQGQIPHDTPTQQVTRWREWGVPEEIIRKDWTWGEVARAIDFEGTISGVTRHYRKDKVYT